MLNLNQRSQNLIRLFSLDKESRRFKKFLSQKSQQRNKFDSKIFVEASQVESNQLALSIFLPELMQHLEASATEYSMTRPKLLTGIKESIRSKFGVLSFSGVNQHVVISGNWNDKIDGQATNKLKMITDLETLEQFSVEGIRIGDLIYDTYLRRTKNPTIDFEDSEFKNIFLECMAYFHNFLRYFEENDIRAVCVSHCVYHFAIPARIATKKGIYVYQVTSENIYKIDSNKTHAYTEFMSYRQDFLKLAPEEREKSILIARERLELRFSGMVGVDMAYSTKSAFERMNTTRIQKLPKTRKLKVLIATHDFFDSPHSYGDNFYPDFHSWLSRLGEISELTDYEWYIKTHRDSIADDTGIFFELARKYPKIQIVDRDTSHHELIEFGINLALTVYGTIGMEYPALGIPVINASRNNPHANYDFSITPKSRAHYEEMLLNLEKISKPTELSDIYEYYYMAHLHNPKSWIYLNYEKYLEDVGGYSNSMKTNSYKEFMRDSPNRRSIQEIQSSIRRFLESDDYHLESKHFNSKSVS